MSEKCADCQEAISEPIPGNDGRPLCVFCSLDEMTQKEEAQNLLRDEPVVELEAYKKAR
ncbi:hypothetical protein [Euryhalocaulis caribicus]|uniref:hypothetical protein n=1 Tax=Euryhalocaulis caribicus TaxID=1161401 RepID=UPI001377E002|nr:hypothetical protein [Euryhalocaulis caribicus]